MANPENAATDPKAAAQQEQTRRDHDAIEESARRVDESVRDAATDPRAAAQQDQIRRDHDAMEESARRVEASVPKSVRDTPVENIDEARDRE